MGNTPPTIDDARRLAYAQALEFYLELKIEGRRDFYSPDSEEGKRAIDLIAKGFLPLVLEKYNIKDSQ